MTASVQPRAGRARPLTQRQREMLELIARGCSNKEISRQSGLAIGTVKIHVAQAIKRTGSRNRLHAALQWHGITPTRSAA